MFLNQFAKCKGFWTAALSGLLISAVHSLQPTVYSLEPTPTTGEGEITANDVYVRSGDSLNHYTIIKLKAGDRVSIVSERGEWYEIVPPEGTFSLVSGDFIDTTDDQTGTVNGDNVRVRAGSLLNDNKYTVQTLLTKGTSVAILGRNPDGFVRIKPPSGATLWINRSYVQLGGGGTIPPGPSTDASPSQADATPPTVAPAAADAAKKLSTSMGQSASSGASSTTWRRRIEEIDVAARAELAKPVLDRNFAPFVDRYQPIADQSEDDFARQYALARIEQVKSMDALTDAVAVVRKLDVEADAKRREYLAGRATIPEFVPTTNPSVIEIQGELRVSALYPAGSAVRRYRLIDPASESDRTLGYVEIPPDSGLTAEPFLGRYVGVRASAQRVQPGGVNPVPIYVAREFVLLEPPEKAEVVSPDGAPPG